MSARSLPAACLLAMFAAPLCATVSAAESWPWMVIGRENLVPLFDRAMPCSDLASELQHGNFTNGNFPTDFDPKRIYIGFGTFTPAPDTSSPRPDERELSLHPQLPQIDPRIVEALQKVLTEAGDPGVPHLILHLEEQPSSEEQENAVPPEWPSEPSEVEFPSLFVDPVDDPLTIIEEEESLERVVPPAVDWSKLIREVIDAIRADKSVLANNAGAGLQLESDIQLGGARIEVVAGVSGQRFILVSISVEASGDLRAAQRAHNERILHWIESLNEPVFDWDAAEEEDADYGDEPAKEAIP